MSPEAPAFGVAPQRTPVEFDPATSGLRIGPYERRVENPAEPSSVYGAYLSLLYAVRGAKPGERLPLRTADLEALLLIVGDDPATIEERLVGLMGCSAEEASALGKLLLRHRKMTATLGIVAGLSLGTAGVVTTFSDEQPAPAEVVQSVADSPPTSISGTTGAAAPLTPVLVGPPTTPVVVAAPEPAVPAEAPEPVVPAAPVAAAPVAEAPVVDPPAPAAPAPAAPAPAAPAPAAPAVEPPPVVVVAPVEEPAYALPTYAVPVLDAPPPPLEVELPDFDIGEPAVLDGDAPLQEIGGVVDSGHGEPAGAPPSDIGEPAVLEAPGEVEGAVAPMADPSAAAGEAATSPTG